MPAGKQRKSHGAHKPSSIYPAGPFGNRQSRLADPPRGFVDHDHGFPDGSHPRDLLFAGGFPDPFGAVGRFVLFRVLALSLGNWSRPLEIIGFGGYQPATSEEGVRRFVLRADFLFRNRRIKRLNIMELSARWGRA